MPLRREAVLVALPAALAFQGGTPASNDSGLAITHTPSACILAGDAPRIVACATPRSQVARVRLLFQARGAAAWHYVDMASDLPCYAAALPKPLGGTRGVRYVVEAADQAGNVRRSGAFDVDVVGDAGACTGPRAPSAGRMRAVVFAESGRRDAPAGFEGGPALPSNAADASSQAGLAAEPARAAPTPSGPTGAPAPSSSAAPPAATPRPSPPPSASGPPSAAAPPPPSATTATTSAEGHGHGGRTLALVLVGGAAAAGGAVAATRHGSEDASPAAFIGSPGLPADGIGGRWIGDETITYPGGCVGKDQIVLYVAESGGLVTGTLAFTVADCRCCAAGQGASPLSGGLNGTTLQFATAAGFSYSATIAGTRLEGSLAGAGGVTGTWRAERR